MRYVYEVIVADKDGNAVDSVYFSSHKAAKKFKPETGHTTCICQWPVYSEKDVISGGSDNEHKI